MQYIRVSRFRNNRPRKPPCASRIRDKRPVSVKDMSTRVRETIERILRSTQQHLNFNLAFKCTCNRIEEDHLMKVKILSTKAYCLCTDVSQELSLQQRLWLVSNFLKLE